ncbi:MAG: helix-turn-helix transcriptional regulator [Muribaculaceae bacterium]|nr:helix-turn-helix transcriptional regulator [Muribaculaceae bacterium]
MDKTEYQLEVISRIRKLRIENEVSQVGLANLIDVSNGQIGNIESPKFKHKYTLKQLYLIAQHFKVSLDYILTGSDKTLGSTQLIEELIKYDE